MHVDAPPALARVLSHVGVGVTCRGCCLATTIATRPTAGVARKVTCGVGMGFVSAADAPSAAAKRLAERNRLVQLEAGLGEANTKAETAKAEFEKARSAVEQGCKV